MQRRCTLNTGSRGQGAMSGALLLLVLMSQGCDSNAGMPPTSRALAVAATIADDPLAGLPVENVEAFDLKRGNHLPAESHEGIQTPNRFGQSALDGISLELANADVPDQPVQGTPARKGGKAPQLQSDGSFSLGRFFDGTAKTGDIDDVTIGWGDAKAMQFVYKPAGHGPHEWEHKYIRGKLNQEPARQAGVVWLSPPNDFGSTPQSGFNLQSLSPMTITWEARSLGDPAWVNFYCGGVAWKWKQSDDRFEQIGVDYPDSAPYQSLGCRELKQGWQTFRCQLPTDRDYSRVVAGFGWNMSWAENGITSAATGRKITFEVRNVRYESAPAVAADDVLHVYSDADATTNSYFHGGVMGDVSDIITSICTDRPHAGRTCAKLVYTAEGTGPHVCDYAGPCHWAGDVWQFPPSNWGTHDYWKGLGRNLSQYKRLVFWTRADQECEIDILMGSSTERYGDSLKRPLKQVVKLTTEWAEHSFPLDGDLSHIISGFGWVTSQDQNPRGITWYLDDVYYTKDATETAPAKPAAVRDTKPPR